MENISRSQNHLSPEYSQMLFKRHFQGALVRSGASVIMGLFAIVAFYIGVIEFHHLAGVSFSIMFLILINPPTLWLLKRIKSRSVYRYFSLLINFLEIIGYTGIIYSLGGIEATYLTPIYAALITYVGTVSPRSFPFIIAALCALAFSSIVTLDYLGYLPHQSVFSDFRLPLWDQMIRLSVVIGLLFITAYISSYTASILKKTRNKLHRMNTELQASVKAMSREIAVRKQAEEALRESEEKYRTILESIENGYFEVDVQGNFTFFNDSLCEILGYPKDELMGMKSSQCTDKENEKKLYQAFNRVFTTGKPDKGFDWEIIRKDGTKRSIDVSVSLRKDAESQPIGLRGIVRDISDKRRLEAEIQKSQKMEAIATLAGGIAHQFNNALANIVGNIELLEMDHHQDDKMMGSLENMKASGRHMATLTSQLLAYARGGKYNAQSMSLSRFVRDTVPLLEHTLNPDVRVETDLSLDIFPVYADPTQIQMLLSALMSNANEAMKGPGHIRISTRNVELDQSFIKQHQDLKPGPYVCLSIEDDGKGMDEEVKKRIFDPFFTTHFIGRGLGMPAAYGIVKNHHGTITVDSQIGKGSVFIIYLPAVVEKVVSEPKVELAVGEGTILVVEDEEFLLKTNVQLLDRLGYQVLEAKSGKEAVELVENFDGRIDLVLLDIKLPDMSGNRIYPLIMEARPNLKVVVCSGYSIDGPAQEILNAGAEGFIQKPFSISTLAEKLKEVLGKK